MTRLQRVAVAALAGLAATLAVIVSPLLAGLGPIVPPYVPIDLRWIALPLAFALVQFVSEFVAWPGPATSILGVSLMAVLGANLPASQVLSYLGVPWATPAPGLDLLVLAASLGAVSLGLWIAFDAAHERFREQMEERGLEASQLDPVTQRARAQARQAVAIGALAVAGLGLLVRLSGGALGGASVPLPELGAIGLVLALGALMVGLPRLRTGGG